MLAIRTNALKTPSISERQKKDAKYGAEWPEKEQSYAQNFAKDAKWRVNPGELTTANFGQCAGKPDGLMTINALRFVPCVAKGVFERASAMTASATENVSIHRNER